jgi:hypothetical protein
VPLCITRWQGRFDVAAFSPEVARLAQQQEMLGRADERVALTDREAMVYLVCFRAAAVLAGASP